jgi:hypothetical protein
VVVIERYQVMGLQAVTERVLFCAADNDVQFSLCQAASKLPALTGAVGM